MFNKVQQDFDKNLHKIASNNVLKKLNKQGIQRTDIDDDKFSELITMEIDILKSDGKKVGAGIGVGIAISFLTGGLF